jgi:hypothetical protein|tara:strand:- start:281 stop:682 length:402 start_codon:yes stop_codon:yes gene_type:complete
MHGTRDGLTERKAQDMQSESSIAYLAGLFDGEGSVMYKQYIEKRKNRPNPMKCWRIRLDVAMTDKETIKYIYDTLDVGWWGPRTVRPGRKPQWRWSTSYRGANRVARLFLPYAKTKKEVLQKIVDHYDKRNVN